MLSTERLYEMLDQACEAAEDAHEDFNNLMDRVDMWNRIAKDAQDAGELELPKLAYRRALDYYHQAVEASNRGSRYRSMAEVIRRAL